MTEQLRVPGVIGFAPATDHLYLGGIQRAAAGTGAEGLVNSLRLVYATLDTDRFFELDAAGRTDEAGALISAAADSLAAAGADFLVVTSNTGSIIMGSAGPSLPMLDIFDVTMAEVVASGHRAPGILSTRRTAASGRYHEAAAAHGARVVDLPGDVVDAIDRVIDTEAIRGIQTEASLGLLQGAVDWLAAHGADSVVLGCTDLVLFGLDAIAHGVLPMIDSTAVHASAAARRALGAAEIAAP